MLLPVTNTKLTLKPNLSKKFFNILLILGDKIILTINAELEIVNDRIKTL